MSFVELGVRSDVVTRLTERGILEPFPIQAATIADALAGRDVCGRAPTGSGKTIAFGIPLVCGVGGKASPRQPRGLVLVPTRELANQVAEELRALAGSRARVSTVYGGVGYGDQLRALRRGVDILVACPGRLKDLVARNECRLDDVSFVVIDEADRMADMGFLPEVRRLLDLVRPDRQTLLFSATLDGDIKTLIERYQNDPVRHEVEGDEDAPQNMHLFWKTDRAARVNLVADIVRAEWPAIVFCRTKHGAERLSEQLGKAGVSAAAIHGDKSQSQRERALKAFTNSKVQCLVATDVAARGIHVDAVGCVVHFDPPADEKDYIHRSGRTGRAGAAGKVVSILMPDQVKTSLALQRRVGLSPTVDRADIATINDAPRVFVSAPESSTPVRPERAARGNRQDRPARPTRQRKPRVQVQWGADRPAGTGHPRARGPVAVTPKHNRKGGGAPGRVGGVRRKTDDRRGTGR
ncbi:MAG TPA: DEAD/DEAH box helicase [Acidimicrobiales bacterium]|nr:DEAD/DEAH box helicase [Acidimicrobiales bacterium]